MRLLRQIAAHSGRLARQSGSGLPALPAGLVPILQAEQKSRWDLLAQRHIQHLSGMQNLAMPQCLQGVPRCSAQLFLHPSLADRRPGRYRQGSAGPGPAAGLLLALTAGTGLSYAAFPLVAEAEAETAQVQHCWTVSLYFLCHSGAQGCDACRLHSQRPPHGAQGSVQTSRCTSTKSAPSAARSRPSWTTTRYTSGSTADLLLPCLCSADSACMHGWAFCTSRLCLC